MLPGAGDNFKLSIAPKFSQAINLSDKKCISPIVPNKKQSEKSSSESPLRPIKMDPKQKSTNLSRARAETSKENQENSDSSSSDDIFDFMDGDATKAIKRNKKKDILK